MNLALKTDQGLAVSPISPRLELGAYEALWLQPKASFKSIAERFAKDPEALPSDFVQPEEAERTADQVLSLLRKRGINRFGIRTRHAGEYPLRLRDARYPIELLYFRGTWEFSETRSVAVVGARNASDEGIARAKRLARQLSMKGITVVSGLAMGIDTAAHQAAITAGGRTIAVVGTPLGWIYPKENLDLQEAIATDHLLISQVPVLRYAKQGPSTNRWFFPERNVTMSALTEATVIVEASEKSGTLVQARAALAQGRKLFVLDSAFKRSDITWPQRFQAQGAIRVKDVEEIVTRLD